MGKMLDGVLEASLCSFEELESNVLGTNDLKQRILVELKTRNNSSFLLSIEMSDCVVYRLQPIIRLLMSLGKVLSSSIRDSRESC